MTETGIELHWSVVNHEPRPDIASECAIVSTEGDTDHAQPLLA